MEALAFAGIETPNWAGKEEKRRSRCYLTFPERSRSQRVRPKF